MNSVWNAPGDEAFGVIFGIIIIIIISFVIIIITAS